MSFFQKMNAKLDDGYKMTNINCDKCKFSLLINPANKLLYCPKCDYETTEPAQLIVEKQDNDADALSEEPDTKIDDEKFNEDLKNMFSKPSKSDEISQKLAQKLLQGWAMLEEVCPDCQVPIMRSRQGEKLCVKCDNAYQRPPKVNNVSQEKLPIKQEQNKPITSNTPLTSKNQQNHAQAAIKQSSSNSSKQDISDKLLQTLSKLIDFYDQKLDIAISENDMQKISFLSDKIFEIVSNFNKLIQ